MHSKNQQLGFTLIELMVAIAILAIVLGVGIPSYRDLIVNNRMAGEINDFVGSLRITRSEAIKRGVPVRMCASDDGQDCANSGPWSNGWIIFEVRPDSANCNALAQAAGDCVRVYTFSGTNNLAGANNLAHTLTFDANGFVRGDDNAIPVNNTLIMLCDPDNDNDKARAVEMSLTGLTTIRKHADDPANVKCS